MCAGFFAEVGGDHVRITAHLGRRAGRDHAARRPAPRRGRRAGTPHRRRARPAARVLLCRTLPIRRSMRADSSGPDAGHRLVEQHQPRAAGERHADLERAALAVRELRRCGRACLGGEADVGQHLAARARTAPARVAPAARRQSCRRELPARPARRCRARSKLRNSRVIWNERTSPRRARWCGDSRVMSWPSKTIRPRSLASSPAELATPAWSCRRRSDRSAHASRRAGAQVHASVASRPPNASRARGYRAAEAGGLVHRTAPRRRSSRLAVDRLRTFSRTPQRRRRATGRPAPGGRTAPPRAAPSRSRTPSARCTRRAPPAAAAARPRRPGRPTPWPTPPRMTITIRVPDCVQCSTFGLT